MSKFKTYEIVKNIVAIKFGLCYIFDTKMTLLLGENNIEKVME